MKLIDYFASERGAQAKLAKTTGICASSLSAWATGDRPVPVNRCLQIERATEGKVTRPELRDDWANFWPELRIAAPSAVGEVQHG